jgi:hypothetical protein
MTADAEPGIASDLAKRLIFLLPNELRGFKYFPAVGDWD